MTDVKIGVILGSTRPGRNGEAVAAWVLEQAQQREASYQLIDLADHPLPLLDEPVPPIFGQYEHEHTKAWSATISAFDGYIFVTPEYNHSTSGVLKNAIDYLFAEWANKSVGFVGYGSVGAARAVEQLRSIAGEIQLADVRQALAFFLSTDFEDYRRFKPQPSHEASAQILFDQVEAWAEALKPLRSS